MAKHSRRHFLSNVGMGLGAATLSNGDVALAQHGIANPEAHGDVAGAVEDQSSSIDFRYAPMTWQTAYCFPDDPHKSLVGEGGELRYGHPGNVHHIGDMYFTEIVEFSLLGMSPDRVHTQRLEAPGVPIVHTRIDRPEAYLELTTFATNQADEGRVDNVLIEILPRIQKELHACPRITIRTKKEISTEAAPNASLVFLEKDSPSLFMALGSTDNVEILYAANIGLGMILRYDGGPASYGHPLRYFARFPQAGQDFEQIQDGLKSPEKLLSAAREYWQDMKFTKEPVAWSLPSRQGEFLDACARNIVQAREVKDGKLNFQVGPTVYRGLWVVDGNFILEAARYLGYDVEAQQGLEATWDKQGDDGGIFAGAGHAHWKDTGIAMFTLVRQAELQQDWGYFRKMQPQVLLAVKFLKELREKAQSEDSAMGRYGLLPRGFGDGGLGGMTSEFTNTLWVLTGLKAVTEAADRLRLPGFEDTKQFYENLHSAFRSAARQEMRQHEGGFSFLPMLMKEDPQWTAANPWKRPQPQIAQWALSHSIFPGSLFDKTDPIVTGHIALMQECTKEDVPAEAGWLWHGGLWTYNAPFVAEVYLWAGLTDWARRTFVGFLNHATPLYCWREEQPLQDSIVAECGGDMPHNWASAECVRYLRHMVALEDGNNLSLLAGIGDLELNGGNPYRMENSPTRFGRVGVQLEPLDRRRGWRMVFERGTGPDPASIGLPSKLGSRFGFADLKGAAFKRQGNEIQVDPQSTSWQAVWKV